MILIDDERYVRIWKDMLEEYKSSCEKHPMVSKDLVRRAGVVLEEAGEAFKEAMNATRPGNSMELINSYREDMRKELVQTMSSAFKMILSIDMDVEREVTDGLKEKILS